MNLLSTVVPSVRRPPILFRRDPAVRSSASEEHFVHIQRATIHWATIPRATIPRATIHWKPARMSFGVVCANALRVGELIAVDAFKFHRRLIILATRRRMSTNLRVYFFSNDMGLEPTCIS